MMHAREILTSNVISRQSTVQILRVMDKYGKISPSQGTDASRYVTGYIQMIMIDVLRPLLCT